MFTSLWADIKQNPGMALLFLFAGFVAGLGTYKYVSGFFNADVVLHDSYVYKSEIEKSHVPREMYVLVQDDLKSTKVDNDDLKKQNIQLLASQSSMSVSVCQRYAQEANVLMAEQQRVENAIQSALSPYAAFSRKNEQELEADSRRVQESRKHSDLINVQLLQLREQSGKCAK